VKLEGENASQPDVGREDLSESESVVKDILNVMVDTT
jgi:hypothetical protein